MQNSPPARGLLRILFLWIVVALIVLIVLLNLPIASMMEQLQQSELIHAAMLRKKLVVAIIGLGALGIGSWLLIRRLWRALFVGVAAAMLVIMMYGTYKFQQVYPLADFFSAERYRNNAAILLGKDVLLSKFDPKPSLVLERKPITRTAFPAIDVHFHLESLPPGWTPERLVKAMDDAGIAQIVNLGGVRGTFEHFAETYYAKFPDRFIMFAKPDPGALKRANGVAEDIIWLKKAARMGARGLKENKSFGMGQVDATDKLVAVDDPRLDPVWTLAGRLGMPVLIHTGEPPAFWLPVNNQNERYAELLQHPEWSLYGKSVPSRKDLMDQRERLLARHPNTNFIGAHFGMNPDDLPYAAYMLDKYPNYYVDMSSVVQELGRQPYSVRRFFIKYQDRILFGTDGGFAQALDGDGWTAERMYRSYAEFLETENEYIEYPMDTVTKQGNWKIYGIGLPPEVLEKVYVKNAERLITPSDVIRRRLDALESGQDPAAVTNTAAAQ